MNELNTKLRDCAIKHGLCPKWQKDWSENKTQEELVDMYKRGIDFCIKHDYPSIDFMKENISSELLESNLLFVNKEINMTNAQSGIYVLNGNCKGKITFNKFAAATLYIRHNCNIKIEAEGLAKLFVNVYDNAKIEVKITQLSEGKIYIYNNNCEVKTKGKITIKNKCGI